MELVKTAQKLEALGNPTRLGIFKLLVQAGKKGLPVGDIQKSLGVPASTLSHHIAKLVNTGLVVQRRESRTLFCVADYVVMQDLIGYLVDKCCVKDSCC
ncbi:transcriptional regulator [Gammaproteobacteria bacterium 45_16_T64]|nr:transcriptional regulator [Gammaproteobacteria bacterium 45_16_T64]